MRRLLPALAIAPLVASSLAAQPEAGIGDDDECMLLIEKVS